MKLFLFGLLISTTFSLWAQETSLTSGDISLTKLNLKTNIEAQVEYKEIMSVDSITVERLPIQNDPDQAPTGYYCQTKIVTTVGHVNVSSKVENNLKASGGLPIEAVIWNDTKDDGKCITPTFTTNKWYNAYFVVTHSTINFSGTKRFRDYILNLNVRSNSGKVLFTLDQKATPIIRGFDFNDGKEVRSINELELSWAAYYKTAADPRIILQEQGDIKLK